MFDPVFIKFDKYKKAKYSLYINSYVSYFFVTTIHPEEKCLSFMMDRIDNFHLIGGFSYKVIKEVNGDKKIIAQGRKRDK